MNNGLNAFDFLKSAEKLPGFINLNDRRFNEFTVNKPKHIVYPHPATVEYYGDEYNGQTPQSITYEYLKSIEPSKMTDEIYKTLTAKNVKHRTHADTLEPTYFTEGLPI
jgi:hypothetical protein